MASAADLGVESVREVVENVFGLSGEALTDEYLLLCPNPDHPDTNPSCSVNLETGYWNCFACGTGGDLLRLGEIVTDMNKQEVERLLKPSSAEALSASVKARLSRLKVSGHMPRRKPLPGPYASGPLDELLDRGFSKATLKRWGVRFVNHETLEGKRGEFTILNSLAIPVRDGEGHLLCWCYRRTADSPHWQPRYLYTPGVEVSDLWFGMQHHKKAKEVVIVEGALDAMWLDQASIPSLAMLGSKMGERKLLQLQRYQRVYLLGDRDYAGRAAVRRIGSVLGTRVPLFVLGYPSYVNATDPQELSPVDLEIMLERATPWTRWAMKVSGQK